MASDTNVSRSASLSVSAASTISSTPTESVNTEPGSSTNAGIENATSHGSPLQSVTITESQGVETGLSSAGFGTGLQQTTLSEHTTSNKPNTNVITTYEGSGAVIGVSGLTFVLFSLLSFIF